MERPNINSIQTNLENLSEKYDLVENGPISVLVIEKGSGVGGNFLPRLAFRTFQQIPLKRHWTYGDKVSQNLELNCNKYEIDYLHKICWGVMKEHVYCFLNECDFWAVLLSLCTEFRRQCNDSEAW